ncbi:restriction endonuclease subunit S [Caldifermentibacillus hisashii]|uniref:restriction endonuclease subunit S n=1 Tax=Caldifermentibacillus hisashii TaxID=996558 RepID=UPI0031B7BAC6
MDTSLQNELKSVEWKAFKIVSIFEIKRGKRLVKRKQRSGNIPYISSTAENNGVDNFITPPDNMEIHSHCLTITNSGSVGTAFYHPYKFVASDHVTVLKNENLNEYNSQFIIPILNRLKDKYSFNREINNTRLKNETIILPMNKKGEPNWSFMENFMKEVEKVVKPKMKFEKHQITDNRELDKVQWGEFEIQDLFEIKIGKNLDGNKIDKENGHYPYITRKEMNNGLDGFVSWNDDSYLNKVSQPVITIGNETAKPFIQEHDFYTGTKVNIMKPYYSANKYHLMFICTSLERNRHKYSYSYTINSSRLKKQKILLPIKENGEPDWLFMEQHMKRMENEILSQNEIQ